MRPDMTLSIRTPDIVSNFLFWAGQKGVHRFSYHRRARPPPARRSLAKTGEQLYTRLRSGNAASGRGAALTLTTSRWPP